MILVTSPLRTSNDRRFTPRGKENSGGAQVMIIENSIGLYWLYRDPPDYLFFEATSFCEGSQRIYVVP